MNAKTALATAFMAVVLSGCASAEDRLKPVIDYSINMLRGLLDPLIDGFYSLFPSLEGSVSAFMDAFDKTFPFFSGFHWLVYLAMFFVVMAVLAKIWSLSKQYLYNSVLGVFLLLICIHLFGVEMKITLLSLLITGVFGVPGILFLLIMHYSGVIL